MIWFSRPGLRRLALLAALACFLMLPGTVPAQDSTESPQVWLLTYGPGEVYWQRFGHNAIWIRDPARGLDHAFNFGFFDFAQEGFLSNFLLGRLHYFAAASPAQAELTHYVNEDRSIRAQRLDLSTDQFEALTRLLLDQVSRDNREYLYDYYTNNCSTRVRDALDLALGGALQARLGPEPSALDFRDHTRRLTGMDYWLYLGLETGLGSPVDREISSWDALFIPAMLADAVPGSANPETGRPLVVEDIMIHESALAPPPDLPQTLWQRYLLLALAILTVAFLLCRFIRPVGAPGLARLWLGVAGILGSVLAFLWLGTDHWSAGLNVNLLLLNPLWVLVALARPLHKAGAWLVAACGVIALFMPWLPPGQYNFDVLALVLPLNLVSAWILARPLQPRGDHSAANLGE